MFDGPPGTDYICKVCFWQDDASSLRFANVANGPNEVSLVEAQKNYASYGASELRLKEAVRLPGPDDTRDPSWRPIDVALDNLDASFEEAISADWPKDLTRLYYWADNYWLKAVRH